MGVVGAEGLGGQSKLSQGCESVRMSAGPGPTSPAWASDSSRMDR